MLIVISSIFMFLFVVCRRRWLGFLAWISTGFAFLQNVPHFLSVQDYFNTTVFIMAFGLFCTFGYIALRGNLDVMIDTTRFSLLAISIYFPFELYKPLGDLLIKVVTDQTFELGRALGFEFQRIDWNKIVLNGKGVRIILACTGIESMALFAGACFGVRARISKKFKSFLISVPTIYVLNLFRNVFVLASYGYGWFGENSFYIAHNILSKLLAMISLIIITIFVFRELPELERLIVDLKNEVRRVV